MKAQELLEKCIIELNKPVKERNNEIIMDYLRSLNLLMNTMLEKYENSEEILIKMLPKMMLENYNKNDVILKMEQKGLIYT